MTLEKNLPIRSEISASHLAAIQQFAEVGTWFSATERLAMLREIRHAHKCELCQRRKQALSPYSLDGSHDVDSILPTNIVEVIHRIKTDSGRVTERWFNAVMRSGLSPEQYIEIVGLTATAIILDSFSFGIGADILHPNIDNLSVDRPSNVKNPDVVDEGAWVPLMQAPKDVGPVGLPSVPNIARAMGLVPLAIQQFFAVMRSHYGLSGMKFAINRSQTELIAARVSSFNDCFY